MVELGDGAVGDEVIREAEDGGWRDDSGGVGRFDGGEMLEDCGAESAFFDAVLERDDAAEALGEDGVEEVGVEGFEITHVVHGSADALRGEGFGCLEGGVADVAYRDYGHLGALEEATATAWLELMEGRFPIGVDAEAAGVADDNGSLVRELGGVHHVAELVFVEGRADSEVGDGSEAGEVEGSVVCGAVVADDAGAVETDDDGKVLEGYIVDDLVVGALHEGGVDVAERLHALGSETCGEGDSVLFGNANVEGTGGHLFHHDVEGAAGGHGGRDADDAGIVAGEFYDSVTEDILVFERLSVDVVLDLGSGFGVEASRGVVGDGVAFGGAEAFAFFGDDVEEFGSANGFELGKDFDKLFDVVTVDGTKIAESE